MVWSSVSGQRFERSVDVGQQVIGVGPLRIVQVELQARLGAQLAPAMWQPLAKQRRIGLVESLIGTGVLDRSCSLDGRILIRNDTYF